MDFDTCHAQQGLLLARILAADLVAPHRPGVQLLRYKRCRVLGLGAKLGRNILRIDLNAHNIMHQSFLFGYVLRPREVQACPQDFLSIISVTDLDQPQKRRKKLQIYSDNKQKRSSTLATAAIQALSCYLPSPVPRQTATCYLWVDPSHDPSFSALVQHAFRGQNTAKPPKAGGW